MSALGSRTVVSGRECKRTLARSLSNHPIFGQLSDARAKNLRKPPDRPSSARYYIRPIVTSVSRLRPYLSPGAIDFLWIEARKYSFAVLSDSVEMYIARQYACLKDVSESRSKKNTRNSYLHVLNSCSIAISSIVWRRFLRRLY